MKNFINISDISSKELRFILEEAKSRKQKRKKFKKSASDTDKPFEGRTMAMIFEKPSTRTRMSFDIAIKQLGGSSIILNPDGIHYGKGDETLKDTAKVLTEYVDIVMLRTSLHRNLEEFGKHLSIPIINGLSDQSHPCQIIADILTLQENFKTLDNLNICWVGDGNNVCNSWIHACQHFDYNLNISCPEDSFPDEKIIRNYKSSRINIFKDPFEAVKGADVIVTDTWVSMGMKEDPKRLKKFERFQVNKSLMEKTQKQTLFLHCLPAHRGCEVTDEIIDGRNSLVWSEAENRLYAHQAILLWCLNLI